MTKLLDGRKIILASNSPRRKELLAGLELDFEVRVIKGIDESYPEQLKGEEIPKYISMQKARAYTDSLDDGDVLITSDTIVHLDGTVLGKPADEADAIRMLKMLSGKSHEVITGVTVAVRQKGKSHIKSFATTTKVTFKQNKNHHNHSNGQRNDTNDLFFHVIFVFLGHLLHQVC